MRRWLLVMLLWKACATICKITKIANTMNSYNCNVPGKRAATPPSYQRFGFDQYYAPEWPPQHNAELQTAASTQSILTCILGPDLVRWRVLAWTDAAGSKFMKATHFLPWPNFIAHSLPTWSSKNFHPEPLFLQQREMKSTSSRES